MADNRSRKGSQRVPKEDLSYDEFYKRILLTLQEPPGKYPLDEYSSFFYFGLDLKINLLGQVQVIEVNGLNSGMKGHKEAGVTLSMPPIPPKKPSLEELFEWFPMINPEEFLANQEKYYGFYLFIRHEFIKNFRKRRKDPEFALEQDLNFLLRDEPLAYIGARLYKWDLDSRDRFYLGLLILDRESHPEKYTYCSQMPVTGGLGRDNGIFTCVHPEWDRKYGPFAELMRKMQLQLFDKLKTDQFFNGCRFVKPRTYSHTKSGLKKLASDYDSEYVVVKPKRGILGDGFGIRSSRSLALKIERDSNLVLEPFVHSKPILCERNGKYHDGCMRYMILVEESRAGEIQIRHYSGYWRLCPRPLTDFPRIGAVRANLDKGAIPQRLSEEDTLLVARSVEDFVPKFYRSLVDSCRLAA